MLSAAWERCRLETCDTADWEVCATPVCATSNGCAGGPGVGGEARAWVARLEPGGSGGAEALVAPDGGEPNRISRASAYFWRSLRVESAAISLRAAACLAACSTAWYSNW